MAEPATMPEVRKFLNVPGMPISIKEFKEFWESCTEDEKEQFKQEVGELQAA